MIPLAAATVLAVLGCGLLFYLLQRQRRRIGGLEAQLETASADLQRLQQSCARLAPGDVVERLVAGGAEASAERKEVTVLFADIVGYTALSERLEPPLLVLVLNGYFQRMCEAIAAHRGHVSTFLGDGILAYFGALQRNPWQSDDAARAALQMRAALAIYNRELAAQGLPPLGIGIGLHRGQGLAAMIGSRDRMEYAFVGRTVNLAARVQSLTRSHGVDILVTGPVCAALDPSFELQRMPPMDVKGIAEPVVTFALKDLRRAATA